MYIQKYSTYKLILSIAGNVTANKQFKQFNYNLTMSTLVRKSTSNIADRLNISLSSLFTFFCTPRPFL